MYDCKQVIRPGTRVTTLAGDNGIVLTHPDDDQGYVLVKLRSGVTRKFWAQNLSVKCMDGLSLSLQELRELVHKHGLGKIFFRKDVIGRAYYDSLYVENKERANSLVLLASRPEVSNAPGSFCIAPQFEHLVVKS